MRYVLIAVVTVLVPFALSAQLGPLRIAQISGEPACSTCRVEVTRLFTVGEMPGVAVGRDSRIAKDSSGGYVVVAEPGPRATILSSTGQFLRFMDWNSDRSDRSARGVIPMIDPGGGVHIFDGQKQWHFPADPAADRGAAEFPPGFVTMGPTSAPATLLVRAPSALPHRVTLRMGVWYINNPNGGNDSLTLLRDSVVSSLACRDCTDVVLNVAFGLQKGALFSASADRYRINLFHQWGRSLPQSFDVLASWLPMRGENDYLPGRSLPEAPRVTGIWFDQNGCTIPMTEAERVAGRVTDCERRLWVSGLTIRDSTTTDESRRYQTVIDVLGVSARRQLLWDAVLDGGTRVISRVELPGRMQLFGPGLVYGNRALPNGGWALDVFQLRVVDR